MPIIGLAKNTMTHINFKPIEQEPTQNRETPTSSLPRRLWQSARWGTSGLARAYLRGRGACSGGSTPPPEIFRFFGKVKEKMWKEKEEKNEKGWGRGLIVNIFFGVDIFLSGVEIFSGGWRNFLGC